MPQELMDELINLREPIPMRIRVMVMDYCPNFNRKRSDVIGEDEKLIKDIRQERVVARSLEGVKAREYHNNLALEFIEKHPQFAPIIKEIKYIDTVTLFDESWTDSIFQTVYGQVSDAMNGLGVSDAQVKFRNGWNNTSGEYISNLFGDKTTTTDNNGNYSMGLSVGAYTAEISKDGYITAYVNIVSSPNTSVHFSTITPVLADNEYRIILTWGDTPRDLDSHLSGMVNGNSYHVYYGNKSYSYDGITIASLDWDDTSSYGPETITLTWTENNGNCSYYVYDFTNRGNSNSTALSYSSAKVVVYKGNTLLNTYNVPIGFSGTTWNVFSINNGDLTTINTIS